MNTLWTLLAVMTIGPRNLYLPIELREMIISMSCVPHIQCSNCYTTCLSSTIHNTFVQHKKYFMIEFVPRCIDCSKWKCEEGELDMLV